MLLQRRSKVLLINMISCYASHLISVGPNQRLISLNLLTLTELVFVRPGNLLNGVFLLLS